VSTVSRHWESVYTTKAETDVSWFQAEPALSLELIRTHAPDLTTPIIDIGGGASRLVDELMLAGYSDLAVLDVAPSALKKSKERLGAKAARVDWMIADVTRWRPRRQWGLWHDRAVFHFLTSRSDQDAYINALGDATGPGAVVIVATFALDGPERCSGLPVRRYSADTLAERFAPAFPIAARSAERHTTPSGSAQSFTYAVFIRR